MKTSKWKRILSLALALALMIPTILNALPNQAAAALSDWVDVGGYSAKNSSGQLNSGIYEIYLPDTNLAVGHQRDANADYDTPLYLLDAESSFTDRDAMRWVITYTGSDDLDGDGTAESHYYTIRNLSCGRLMYQAGNRFIKLGDGNTAAEYSQWRLLYNGDTGTYAIQSWGQYYYNPNRNDYSWAAHLAPVVKNADHTNDNYSVTLSPTFGALMTAEVEPFGWELRQVSVQNYSDATRLEYGTYTVSNTFSTSDGSKTMNWTSDTDSSTNYSGLDTYYGLRLTGNSQSGGNQSYVLDWTSQGYVTFFDSKTGRYIGDWNGHTRPSSEALSNMEITTNHYIDQYRYMWIPIPAYTSGGTARLTDQFCLCNVLTGRFLYLNTSSWSSLENVTITKYHSTAWYFDPLTVKEASKDTSQGYNGVYLDSFDSSDTIRLPITIYDYVSDGMLFEYAETNASGTIGDYIMGNNKAYSFQGGSTGGYYNGTGAFYTDNNGLKADGTQAWNAYNTVALGKTWYKYTSKNGWYSDGNVNQYNGSSSLDYYWEVDGLNAFRNAGASYLTDQASVYLIYAINKDTYQGLGSMYPTYSGSGASLKSFTTPLWSGDTSLNPNGTLSHTGYSYNLYGQVMGVITLGLVQPELNPVTNAPEYRDVVVEYLAKLLSQTLSIPHYSNNQIAYNYVAGTVHERYSSNRDFASWLRSRIINANGSAMGTYAQTYAKREGLIGTWEECKGNITTFCDAAYFMLNNLFVSGSYNEEQDMFDYLELTSVKMDDADGNIVDGYVFDSGFTKGGTGANSQTAVYYDTTEKTISNRDVTGKASAFLSNNNTVCAHPFLPVWSAFDTATQTGTQESTYSPYFNDDGVSNTDTSEPNHYVNRNYNFVMASNGQFRYSYDDELFFNFEGDDDVYLFINGQLVLDIGGAHAISSFYINLNDYVDEARAEVAAKGDAASDRAKALALEDGAIYTFDFYYMERHGWGSNMRIATNIQVAERDMIVEKDAAQNGKDLSPNDIIDPDDLVEYTFSLTNTGSANLIMPTFTDSKIGVTISYSTGLTVTGSNVYDANHETLDVKDLVVTYTDPDGNVTTRTFQTQADLTDYLTRVLVIETKDGARPPYGKLTIGGIYYELTDEDVAAGVFTNTVDVTAYIRNNTDSTESSNVPTGSQVTVPSTADSDPQGDTRITVSNNQTTDQIRPTITVPGVTISPEAGLTVTDSSLTDENGGTLDVTDLTFTYTDPDGNVTVKTFQTNTELMEYLQDELVLEPGGTLTVEGIRDPSPDGTVTVTTWPRGTDSTDSSNTSTGERLEKQDDFTVYVIDPPSYYQWRGHALEISNALLREDLSGEGKTVTALTPTAISRAASDEFWISNGNLYAKFQTTGTKQIYLQIDYTYTDAEGISHDAQATIPINIYVLDVQSATYVLDYGLHVELDDLLSGDTLSVAGPDTVFEILGIATEDGSPYYADNNVHGFSILMDSDGKIWETTNIEDTGSGENQRDYNGIFKLDTDTLTLTYTPTEFLEGRDDLHIAIRVHETGYTGTAAMGDVDIRREVEMYKTITFLPANVVYYEDYFAAVNATNGTQTTTDEYGQPQHIDQEWAYGYDDVYSGSGNVQMSGGSIYEVPVTGDPEKEPIENRVKAAEFTFQGTGFEILSRTNAADSASIQVSVEYPDGSFRYFPIITEFDQTSITGEAIYQVPVFRLDDLEYGTYTVTILGVPTVSEWLPGYTGIAAYADTTLYLDGIRIYDPLGPDSVAEYTTQDGAQFTEIRNLIFNEQAAAVRLSYDAETGEPILSGAFGTHYSFAEDRNGWFTTNGGLQQYIIAGPNNELYLGNSTDESVYSLVFYVKETASGTGLFHIGVHDLDENGFYGSSGTDNTASAIRYWQDEGDEAQWSAAIAVGQSGTEQYYAINYRNCPTVTAADGSTYYAVALKVDAGMVSFTSVKTVGLEFGSLDAAENVRYKYENGILYQAELDENGNIVTDEDGNELWISVENLLMADLLQQVRSVLMVSTASYGQAVTPPAVEEPEEPTPDTPEVEEPEQPSPDTPEVEEPEQPTPDTPEVEEPEQPTPDTPEVEEPEQPTPDTPEVEEPETVDPAPGEAEDEEIPKTGDLGLLILTLLMAAAVTLGCLKRKHL